MRLSRRGAGLLALAALLLPGAVHADDLLVMPYSCSVAGGQPLLTPAAERGYRILGPRDQRKFTACSPANPDLCRTWTVHRFDLDCDGTRVPWVSVVAATNEGSRRAWLLDGRLVLRMGPRWSLPADDPCAQEAGPDQQRFDYRRMRRLCADRLALAPPPVVEMPFGYAPMLGLDGIFVKGGPAVAGGQPSLPPIAAAPPGASTSGASTSGASTSGASPSAANPPGGRSTPTNPMPELFPSEPPPVWHPFAEEDPARPASAAPSQAAPIQPPPPPKVATAPPSAPASPAMPPATEAPKTAPSASKPPAAEPNLGPRIVTNAPKAATEALPASPAPVTVGEAVKTAPPAAKPAAAESTKAATASPSPRAAEAVAPPPKPAEPSARKAVDTPEAPARSATEPDSGGPGVSLLSVFRTTTVGALVAFGGLALGLLTAFALARRNESMRDARRRPRDLGTVSLGDKRPSPPARIANARGSLPPNAAASAMSRAPGQSAAASPVADLGERMPRTRTEAMQVLGIGVAPTASEAAIKKIVDGLRQSWHPDHAKDEIDRALREVRSKQINAAWELLRQQRAVV